MNYEQLRTDIIEEIGPDAYSCYNEERYAIGELVLHVLADACLIEFLKGFFDFESLGKGARARIDQFIKEFRDAPELVTLDIRPDVNGALRVAEKPSEESITVARDHLRSLLVSHGMDKDPASVHAAVIADAILSTLAKRASESI
jgi:hypothetical protein